MIDLKKLQVITSDSLNCTYNCTFVSERQVEPVFCQLLAGVADCFLQASLSDTLS